MARASKTWNMDETGLLWKALPNHGYGVKGKDCHSGKKNKQQITVAFLSQQLVKEKSQLLHGDLKIHDA